MSSLVLRQRQTVAPPTDAEKENPKKSLKKGHPKRSASFDKLLVTAFQIRLACSKCSRDSLKLCIEMLVMRWTLIARQSIVALLEIANVIIPKWQTRARDIIDSTIVQRQWRRRQQERETAKEAAAKVPVPKTEEEKEKSDPHHLLEQRITLKPTNQATGDPVMRQALTIAVTGCIVLLAVQVCLGVALLIQTDLAIPWGLVFLVSCVIYIAYLLQSICDYDRESRTTCNFGGTKVAQRIAKKVVVEDSAGRTTKVVELSFIEKTMSRVKLL